MSSMNDLDKLLELLEKVLVREIPNAIKSARMRMSIEIPPHYIWCVDEVESPEQSFDVPFETKELTQLCRKMYQILDLQSLSPLSKTLDRVSTELTRLDWQQLTNVTDDFVVLLSQIGLHNIGDF